MSKKITYSKHLILVLLTFFTLQGFSQIQFANPSFEQGGSPPTNWPFCGGSTDVEPGVFSQLPASDGARYLGFWDGGATTFAGIPVQLGEGTMQRLLQDGVPCALVAGKTYTFEMDIQNSSSYDPGAIAFIGGFAQCQPSALLWRSDGVNVAPDVGPTWQRYSITFTPTQAYSWIGFYAISRSSCGLLGITCGEGIYIDNLSTITKLDGTVASTNASCQAGGTIKFTPAAGTTGPLSYTWTDGAGNPLPITGNEALNLTPGNYTLEVRDNSENCPVPTVFNVTITGSPAVTGKLSLDKSTLCEGESAQLGFTPDNPSAVYDYKWTPAAGLSNSNIANPVASPTQTRTYTLTVKDPNDPTCVLTLDTTINYVELNAGLPNSIAVCEDEGTANLFNEIGGTPDSGGSWTKPDGTVFDGNIDYADKESGNYTYTVSHTICPSEQVIIDIAIDDLVDAGEDGEITVCNTSQSIDLLGLLNGSPDNSGTWLPNPEDGYNASNGTYNPNAADENSYEFTYQVLAAATCPDDEAIVTVNVEEVPIISVEDILPICEGNQAEIIYDISAGAGNFNISISEDGINQNFNNMPANGSIFITPNPGSNYILTKVVASGNQMCVLDTNIALNFTFNTPPTISLISTDCDANNINYTVSMSFANGDQSTYTLNDNIDVSGQSTYTSDPIASGTRYTFYIKDAAGCLPVDTISGIFSCGCATKVGTIINTGDTTTVCDGSNAIVMHNGDGFRDANDTLSYILHDSPDASIGTVVAHNSSGTFTFDAATMQYNKVYFMSAVAGNESTTVGLVDLSNPDGCLDIAPGQAIIFRRAPAITDMDVLTKVCPSDAAIWEISTNAGRLPMLVTDDAGNTYNITTSPQNIQQQIFQDTSIVLSTITDDYGCTTTINNGNGIILSATVLDSIYIENYTFTCNATYTGFVAEFDITGGDASSYQIINSNITGTLDASGHYISDELPNGFQIDLQATDGNACNTPQLLESGTCPCATVSGEMDIPSTSAPLEFCIENTASVNFRDNNNDGIADGYNPDGNDVQSYILLQNLADTAQLPAPNFIQHSATPSFAFDAATMNTNTVYYVVPVAGDADASGNLVDFTVGCRDYADGTPIRFNEPATIAFTVPQEICLGADIPVSVTVTSTSNLNFTLVADNGFSQQLSHNPGTQTVNIPNNQLTPVSISIDTITAAFEDGTAPTACRARWISAPLSVNIINTPTATFSGKLNNTICQGETINMDVLLTGDGTFDVDLNTGATYTDNGSSGIYSNAFTVSPTDSSSYTLSTVQVTTALGLTCVGTVDPTPFDVAVNAIDNSTFTFGNGMPICADNDALLSASVMGDNPEYMLYITNPAGNSITRNTTTSTYNFNRQNLQQTETFVLDSISDATLSDATGNKCWFYPNTTATQVVNPLPTAALSLTGDDVICQGESTAYTVNVTGAFDVDVVVNNGFSSDSLITLSSASREVIIFPVMDVNFSIVSVVDANGCVATDFSGNADVTVKDIPLIDIVADKMDSCVALNVNFTNNTQPEFLGTCLWDFGDGNTSNSCGDVSHTYNASGTYLPRFTVTSPEDCSADSALGTFIAHPNPIAAFDINPENINVLNSEVILRNITDIAVQSIWTVNNDLIFTDNNISLPLTNLPIATEIPVKLYVETPFGCTDSIVLPFIIDDVTTVYIPEAFSPNGDGINETFSPVMTGVTNDDFLFQIFNRWGELIFESKDAENTGWDGSYRNELVKPGVYSYIIQYKTPNKDFKIRDFGKVVVIR